MARPSFVVPRLRVSSLPPLLCRTLPHLGHRPASSKASTSPSPSTIPKPRLDYRSFLAHPDQLTQNHTLRKSPLPPSQVPALAELYQSSLTLSQRLDSIRADQKKASGRIKAASSATEREIALAAATILKSQVQELEAQLSQISNDLLAGTLLLPNSTHPSSPLGPEDNALTISTFGPSPSLRPASQARDHLRTCLHFGWLSPPSSSLTTGSSWHYLLGGLSLLELALINYAVSKAVGKGWMPVGTMDVVKEDVMARCGFIPRDQAGQTYYVSTSSSPESEGAEDQGKLVLAATAEIPLAALHANQILPPSSLPVKMVGIGHAFRAEAGARGADTRGLYRVHQFTKVELFAITEGNGMVSEAMMEEMGELQREIFEGLGLSVRVLDMPTEELGASAYRKYDMEAWMPGRGKWGEISSTSNCTDYQSRRLHIRHRGAPSPVSSSTGANAPTTFAHTLNGTAAAIPRLLVALLENGVVLGGESGEEILGLELPAALKPFWVGPEGEMPGKKACKITWV